MSLINAYLLHPRTPFAKKFVPLTTKKLFSSSSFSTYRGLQQLSVAHSIWKDFLEPGDLVYDATCGNGHDSLFLASLIFTSPDSLASPSLICTDIQSKSVYSAVKRLTEGALENKFPLKNLSNCLVLQHNHATLPSEIKENSISLACFNLGYLPGSIPFQQNIEDKSISSINEDLLDKNISPCVYRISSVIQPEIHPTLGKIITKTESTIKALEAVCYYGLKSSKIEEIELNSSKNRPNKGGLLSIMCYPFHSGGDEEHEAVQNFLKQLVEKDPKRWKISTYAPFPHNKQPILYLVLKI